MQKDQRIQHQCQDGDVLQIRKGFRYKINWNNQIFECIYYTNIPFESLLLYFLTINHVINDTSYKSNFYFDGVQRNAVIPFQGVSGVLVVKFNGSHMFYSSIIEIPTVSDRGKMARNGKDYYS